MNSFITLSEAMCDYVTVSTFDHNVAKFYKDNMERVSKEEKKPIKHQSRQQYKIGDICSVGAGTIWIGTAVINERTHTLVQVSGELANQIAQAACNQQNAGIAKVTRLDMQITEEEPRGWRQVDLFNRMHEKGFLTEFRASGDKDGRRETVYIGSRQSDRFMRVYVKMSTTNRLIRMETEYKGMRAYAMAKRIAESQTINAKKYLRWELNLKRDEELSNLFGESLGNESLTERITRETSVHKTRAWLLKQVLPTLREYVNGHGNDHYVVGVFMDALTDRDLRPDDVNHLIRVLEHGVMGDDSIDT